MCKKKGGDGIAEGNLWGMSSMGSNLLQLTGIWNTGHAFGIKGSLLKCQSRHQERTAEIWAHLSILGDCTLWITGSFMPYLRERPSAVGKKITHRHFWLYLEPNLPLHHAEQRLALELNAKHLGPTQTLGSSSKNASVTQGLHRIYLCYENPGKDLISLGESEGTSSSFRHKAGDYLSQKIPQGTLLSFRHSSPTSQKLRHPLLKSYKCFLQP